MKIQLLSDVHYEFWRDASALPYRLLKHVRDHNINVVIVAGDLTDSWGLANGLGTLCRVLHPTPVLYTPGNHEYYGSSPKVVTKALADLVSEDSNLHLLDCSSVSIQGLNFGGATLWFPDSPLNVAYHHSWTDFYNIYESRPWIYEQNVRACEFFTNTQLDVCISHHLPSYQLVAPKWKGEDSNRFFVTEILTQIPNPPKLWLFGHTHELTNQLVDSTRCIANPRGYPREHPGGESYVGLTIEL